MTQLVTLRLAYWRQVITAVPCPEPLCGAAEGRGCAGPYEQLVHQSRLRIAMAAREVAEAAGQPVDCAAIVEGQGEHEDHC